METGMRSLFLTAFLASALIPAMGCNLYFSGGDGDPPCEEWGGGSGGGAEAPDAPNLLRNPETGVCEDFGWGGPGPFPCDSVCGPCAGSTEPGTTPPNPQPDGSGSGDDEGDSAGLEQADPVPQPTWGQCDSYCTGLEEGSCLATQGCRGIYAEGVNEAPGEYLECWATDQNNSGIVDCEGLDAYSCSTSDACVAVHEFACDDWGKPSPDGFQEPECVPGFFLSCHNEVQGEGCYGDQDCGVGSSCNADELCLPPPGNGEGDAVPAVCYGYCEPDTCPPVDVDCPADTIKVCPADACEALCTCEPIDPGECDGDVFCESLPPLCEAGTTPGIANGCWTGQCIDLSLCPDANCGDIVGESMCIARDDCSAYYVGDDCSCDANGCTCTEWVFDSCGSDAL